MNRIQSPFAFFGSLFAEAAQGRTGLDALRMAGASTTAVDLDVLALKRRNFGVDA